VQPQRTKDRIEDWRRQGVVTLSPGEWESAARAFREVERHPTNLAGDLLVLRIGEGFAVLEEPTPDRRVLRFLADREAARRFVSHRMGQYERIWDGCGCRIDYLAPDPEPREEAP